MNRHPMNNPLVALLAACMGITSGAALATGIASIDQNVDPMQTSSAGDMGITSVVAGEAGLLCDTCMTDQALIQAAKTPLPRAQDTIAYVMNRLTGRVLGVYINYLGPGEQEVRPIAVDPLVQQWVAQVGQVYRDNGNSLHLRLVARADGSMYWVRANGSIEEMKDPDPRISDHVDTNSTMTTDEAPPNSAPIDLRSYQFSEPSFSARYPAFPQSSYDFAFNNSPSVDGFVRDQTAGIKYGTATGVINGTVSASGNGGVTTPVVSVVSGTTVTSTLTSTLSVYVPMKDGGYALVSYDKKTGVVTLVQLYDGQEQNLLTNHPTPQSYLSNNPLRYNMNSGNGNNALNSFLSWASRNNIPVVVNPAPWTGGYSCQGYTSKDGAGVTCKKQY